MFGSLRLSSYILRRASQNSRAARIPAAYPGVHHVTSGTLRSIVRLARTDVQSVAAPHTLSNEEEEWRSGGGAGTRPTGGGIANVSGRSAAGSASSGGKSVSHVGSFSVIFFRIVRAPTSCLSDAIHTGTTLCASTS